MKIKNRQLNKQLRKSLNAYYCEIGQLLPFSGNQKSSFMSNLKNNVDSYLEEHPLASFEDVLERFGTPADIVESDIDIDTYSSVAVKSSKRLRLEVILAACLCALAVLFGFLALLFHEQAMADKGYYITKIEEISSSDSDAIYDADETAIINTVNF